MEKPSGIVNSPRSLGSEHPVARIPEARNDVSVVVQVIVNCGRDNRDIRMSLLHPSRTLGRCE